MFTIDQLSRFRTAAKLPTQPANQPWHTVRSFQQSPAMSEIDDHEDTDEAFTAATLTQAIENQLEADSPAAAKATYNKLTLVGYPREEILELMAQVLAYEVRAMLDGDRPFNLVWYEQALRALPELPKEPS